MSVYFSLSLSLSLFPWIRIDRNGELRADILNEIFQWYSLAAVIISYYIYIYIHTLPGRIHTERSSVTRSDHCIRWPVSTYMVLMLYMMLTLEIILSVVFFFFMQYDIM